MDYQVLLVALLLLAVANGQSTTTSTDSVADKESSKEAPASILEVKNSTKKEETSDKEEGTSDKEEESSDKEEEPSDKEEETLAKEEEPSAKIEEISAKEEGTSAKEVEGSTNEAKEPTTDKPENPEEVLKALDSMDVYTQVTFTQPNSMDAAGDDSGLSTQNIEKEIKDFIQLEEEALGKSSDDSTTDYTNEDKEVSSDSDDDDDEDDDDESEGEEESILKPSSDTKVPVLVEKPEEISIRREGKFSPESERDETSGGDQTVPQDILNDGSPLLYLTEGGYREPYQIFPAEKPRIRPGSASQQSEAVEIPRGSTINGEEAREPPIMPKVPYMAPYQSQINFGAHPVFSHPLDTPGTFGTNGMIQGGLQNGFFNTPPAGFTDFTSANFQSPLHPSANVDFSGISRDQSGISLFQTPPRQNPGPLFQNTPQYLQSQHVPDTFQRTVQNLYQPGSFSNYPGLDNVENTPRSNYYPFLRHPAMNTQFQANPNFYATLRNPGGNDFTNPGMNVQSNYPISGDTQSLPPQFLRYPTPDLQMTLQSSDQVEKQKQESSDPAEEQKDSDGMRVSQDKEDPTIVPFGARILLKNNASDQSDLSGQKDVYLRYPVREAGYATEENLPVQNTSEKNMRNNDPSSSRNPFPIFTSPEDFSPFSTPYRNALHTLQQNYLSDNDKSTDDGNRTGDFPVDQFTQNVPLSFEENLAQPPNQAFSAYPQRSQVPPMFQNRPFYPIPGFERARNPFDLEAGIPENNYRFSPPDSAGDVASIVSTPACAQESNASICFEDPEYPKRELLFALNSAPFLMERLSSPNQVDEDIALVEQNTLENPESEDNYICKSDIKYGLPKRAKNVKGAWKVIVNMEKQIGMRQQPVRLEVCRGANEACSFTAVKTACVQKYSLQRLLSWSPEAGVHNDMFKMPMACSCQILEA